MIPGVTAETHDSVLTGHDDSKFGLAPADAEALISRIEASGSLRMQGLHLHVGSQILQTQPFADAVAAVAPLESSRSTTGRGPGLALHVVRRTARRGGILDTLTEAARAHPPADAEISIEPGRSMVAEAACTITGW